MHYEEIVEKSILYIKEHIDEDLTVEKIADYVGYSPFHFCRIFSLTKHIPLMEYVRKYRLSVVRSELDKENNIFDIAMKWGYESASGFSKSFRREFGYTPSSYRIRMESTDKTFIKNIEEVVKEPKIVKKASFKVAGYGIYTNVSENYTKDIAAYWDSYNGSNLEKKMYDQLKPPRHGEIGICLPYQNNGKAIYLFGVIVDDFSQVTSEMMTIVIPEATYAVFTTPPVNNLNSAATYDKDPLSIAVKETWKYIFTKWIQQSDYVVDESKFDFEFYDERCHASENAVMEIYIPITNKEKRS